jgi:hypothetical protein
MREQLTGEQIIFPVGTPPRERVPGEYYYIFKVLNSVALSSANLFDDLPTVFPHFQYPNPSS